MIADIHCVEDHQLQNIIITKLKDVEFSIKLKDFISTILVIFKKLQDEQSVSDFIYLILGVYQGVLKDAIIFPEIKKYQTPDRVKFQINPNFLEGKIDLNTAFVMSDYGVKVYEELKKVIQIYINELNNPLHSALSSSFISLVDDVINKIRNS